MDDNLRLKKNREKFLFKVLMIHLSFFLTGTEIHVDETFPYSLDEDEVWSNALMSIEHKKKRLLTKFFVRIFNHHYCNMNSDLPGYIRCV